LRWMKERRLHHASPRACVAGLPPSAAATQGGDEEERGAATARVEEMGLRRAKSRWSVEARRSRSGGTPSRWSEEVRGAPP
jgi:hypothetical protein